MSKIAVSLLVAALLISCRGPEMWIPQGSPRAAVTIGHVQFLESPPQRAYALVGIITPPAGQYETEAEAVNAMRKEAAKHGADAIYIESVAKEGGWRFGFGRWGGSGGTFSDVQYRAKAIAWK
jgi:hypothetical protein